MGKCGSNDMMKCFMFSWAVATLCGCDVVPYGSDRAQTLSVLSPLFNMGISYERGTHDLDLGEVKCVFEGVAETKDVAHAYETNGWKVLRLTPSRLVVTRGEEIVEVEMKVFVTNRRARDRDWGLKVSEMQKESIQIPKCTKERR